MMEMVLDVDDIVDEMSAIRDEYCKYLQENLKYRISDSQAVG